MRTALQNREPETRDVTRFNELIRNGTAGPFAHVVLLGLDAFDLVRLLRGVERGFPWRSFEHLSRNLTLAQEDAAALLGIPRRTLARRKSAGRFAPDESDRLLRLARLLGRALELFDGDHESATEWLLSAQPVLGGATPLDMLKTELGAREVEKLIGRLEHGVFS